MSLESLLAPVKWADEQVLRQYTKLTKRWEEKGRSKYSLASYFHISTFALGSPFGIVAEAYLTFATTPFLRGYDMAQNSIGLKEGEHDKGTRGDGHQLKVVSPFFFYGEKVMKLVRLPLFVMGSYILADGITDYFSHDYETALIIMAKMQTGLTTLGFASSIYIKNSDHKLLDKKPAWKQAYDWALKKTSSLAPTPKPVPVETYSTLEKTIN